MPNADLLNRANLGLLPEEKGRYGSFGVSLAVNAGILGLAILLSLAGAHEVKKQQFNSAVLIFPATQPKPVTPPVPKIHVYAPPPKVQLEPPKIALPRPKPVVEPPKMAEMKMPEEAPHLAAAPPKRVTPPPQPKVGMFASAHPTLVANNNVRPSAKTGGFGDPNGVRPNPNANRPATIAAVGSFNATPGVGDPGAGAARRGSVHGVDFGSGVVNGVRGGRDTRGTVASAGFSHGVVGGTGRPGGTGRAVEKGGFGTGFGEAAPARKREVANSTPLVLISKPRPGYTEEARKLKIQGDVTLQVRFTATGQVEVLRVVSGLGYGLDQLAQRAARQIQFKPATHDGRPVDEVTVIHVTFQLA